MIADTWSVDELQDAEALARLEGWGQERRRSAELQAEIHNALRLDAWHRCGDAKSKPPKMIKASDFLPRRAKPRVPISSYGKLAGNAKSQPPEIRRAKAVSQLADAMNAMCGYR